MLFRATVLEVFPKDAKVELIVELAIVTTLPKDKLRIAKSIVLKEPVGHRCALLSRRLG